VGDATRVQLRVSPGASHSRIVGRHGEAWKVRVSAAPEDGKANDAVVRLLAETLCVPRADVELVAGHGARDKVVALSGLAAREVEQRLVAAAAAGGKSAE
jgi:hypothetical protein